MGMFTLLKKSTYSNPPDFKTRVRRWYRDNADRGRNSQIPWYQHIDFLLTIAVCVMVIPLVIYVMPVFF